MTHETPTVPAEVRERTGTRYAQRLRSAGKMPAVVYGHKQDPVAISVDAKEMLQMLERGMRVFELKVGGGAVETVLVKDLQFGYLGDDVVHIDFARVDLTEEVTVNVHLAFVGTPPAAKAAGAILQIDHNEIPVKTTVANIPEEIRIDLSEMEGTHFEAGQVELPAGCTLAEDSSISILHIQTVAAEAEGEEVEVGDGDDA